jgi:hypothetical protein
MISNRQLSALIAVAVAIWAVLLIFGGVALSAEMLRPFSTVTGVLALVLVGFDRYFWRLPWLHPWFVEVPNIRGVWKTQINSTWVNPETEEPIEPVTGFMVIRQTYSTTSIRLMTNESASKVLTAKIVREPDGIHSVIGVYTSEPRRSVRDRSPIHYGGLMLHVQGKPPTLLDGHYWTDRGTLGELTLWERKVEFPEDYASAARLFEPKVRTGTDQQS